MSLETDAAGASTEAPAPAPAPAPEAAQDTPAAAAPAPETTPAPETAPAPAPASTPAPATAPAPASTPAPTTAPPPGATPTPTKAPPPGAVPSATTTATAAAVATTPGGAAAAAALTGIQYPFTNQLDHIKKVLIKSVSKHEWSWPFRKPVNAAALGLTTYHDVIKTPMDLSTVKRKLNGKQYPNAVTCLDDIRLMFKNCYTFNQPTDDVVLMATKLEEYVEEQIKKMPMPEAPMPEKRVRGPKGGSKGSRQGSAPGGAAALGAVTPKVSARSRGNSVSSFSGPQSTPGSVAGGGSIAGDGSASDYGEGFAGGRRPSRLVRPPVKELPDEIASAHAPKRKKSKSNPRIKFCERIVRELRSKKHETYAWPFYEPVDVQALGILDYYKIITKPMDLDTAKKNLDRGVYTNADDFVEDIRTIFKNCYKYNPPDHDVVALAKQTQTEFEKLLQKMPVEVMAPDPVKAPPAKRAKSTPAPVHKQPEPEDEDEDDDEDEEDYPDAIQEEEESSDESSDDASSSSSSEDDEIKQQRTLLKMLMSQLNNPKKQKKKKKKKKKTKHAKKKSSVSSTSSKKSKSSQKKTAAKPKRPPAKKPAPAARRPSKSAPPKPKPAPVATTPLKRKQTSDSDSSSEEESYEPEMTYNQKKELSQQIHAMPPEATLQVVRIIQARDPRVDDKSSGEIEIDFAKLETGTLRELEKFVKEYNSKKGKNKPKRPKISLQDRIKQKKEQLAKLNEPPFGEPAYDTPAPAADLPAQTAVVADAGGGGGDKDDSSSSSGSSSSSESESGNPTAKAAATAATGAALPQASLASLAAPKLAAAASVPPTAVAKTEDAAPPAAAATPASTAVPAAAEPEAAAPTEPAPQAASPVVERTSSSEGVVFSVGFDKSNAQEPDTDTAAAPTILAAASAAPKDVEVTNASAWLDDEVSNMEPTTETGASTAGAGAAVSSDFKKFQRQNEERKEREKAAAERAEKQRKEAEAKQAAQLVEAENRRQQADKEALEAQEKKKADDQAEQENAIAEAKRQREEAKKEREAMAGHIDLHEQSALMEGNVEDMFDGEG